MPGSNARALEKAKTLPADALILDLEDAVAPDEKALARDLVCQAVADGGYGSRYLVIRVNGADTEWGAEDLEAAIAAAPDAILLPKVNRAGDVGIVANQLDAAGAAPDLRIWAMMETPLGMLNAAEIADSDPRLEAFVLGTNDLLKDLGALHRPDRLAVQTGLGLCMLAARAHGFACIDGVFNAFRDEDGLRAECEQGRLMGMDGKTVIHPAQLAVANEVFAPSDDEIALAHRQIEAFEQAVARGEGVAVLEGQIVENLHVETARKTLAKQAAITALSAG